jgi:predicted Kef-type K+ transport protein
MKQSGHLSGEIAIGILSIANLCLLIALAFYPRVGSKTELDSTLRTKLGYIAVGLGMCSQSLYCVMLATWRYGWVPFDPGFNSLTHLESRLANIGGLLSVATVSIAMFGRGVRRYAGIWVGGTTLMLWGLVGLGAAVKTLFP